jgi:hypothetical protein
MPLSQEIFDKNVSRKPCSYFTFDRDDDQDLSFF